MNWLKKLFGLGPREAASPPAPASSPRVKTVADLRRHYLMCVAKLGKAEADRMRVQHLLPDGAVNYSHRWLGGEIESHDVTGHPDTLELKSIPLQTDRPSQYKGKEMPIVRIEVDWEQKELICYYGEPHEQAESKRDLASASSASSTEPTMAGSEEKQLVDQLSQALQNNDQVRLAEFSKKPFSCGKCAKSFIVHEGLSKAGHMKMLKCPHCKQVLLVTG